MAQMTVWTTELVDQTIEKLRYGMVTDMSCFHERNIELKGSNILFKTSPAELEEFTRCSMDISYFVEKYCKFLTDKGRATVTLRNYQYDILDELGEEEWNVILDDMGPKNRNYILMASRQTGKTTTIAAFFAWYLCFHSDRNLLILANKEKTAIEIISKVTEVFKGLPFFLKPGIVNSGATGMRLDNGCQLISQATTKTASIGFTIHVLYADEFAHIAPNIVGDFWRSVYPTLSSSEVSQCIISSTPSGTANLFYEIWDKSVKGLNSFMHKRVDYWEVPEHDEAWAKDMQANFGDEYFAQEFGLQFNSDSKNLLGSKESSFLKRIEQKYEFIELEKTSLDYDLYQNLKWKKGFNPNKENDPERDLFVVSVDTGEGNEDNEVKDNDFNVLSIYKLEMKSLAQLRKLRKDEWQIKNMFRLNQVGMYRDNEHNEEDCAKVAKAIVYDQLSGDCTSLLLEMNFNGKYFLSKFQESDEYFDGIVLKTHHSAPIPGEKAPKKKFGFKVGNDKEHYCKLARDLIRKKSLVPNDEQTILEFSAFGKDSKGKYRGIGAHDDTVMTAVNVARLYEESVYEDRLYDILDMLDKSPQKVMINDLLSRFEAESDISDDLFSALYEENTQLTHVEELNKIFKTEGDNMNRYKVPRNFQR